jgi:myo-inositol-1(or 4)-monophosphatase
MKTNQDLLEIAFQATQIGADTLGTAQPDSVQHKGDRDLVTDVDLAIQRDIADYLAKVTPDIPLLAEESLEQPEIAATEQIWVLDPIDGTSNFVHGLPLCAVSLALMQHGRTVVAVTHAALLGRTYHAIKGGGAFLNGRPIAAGRTDSLSAAIVSLGDYAVGPEAAAANRLRIALTTELIPRVERIRMIGAATLDLAFVAEGALDACVMMSNKPWDTAAGTLIAAEAGADVTDVHGNPHTYESASTVATAPGITRQLAGVLQASAAPAGARA